MENNFNDENEQVPQQPIPESEPIENNNAVPETFEPMKRTVKNEFLSLRMSDNEYMEKGFNKNLTE